MARDGHRRCLRQNCLTYQEHSGLLASKTGAKTNRVEFTYLDGLLKTRKWDRAVMRTNIHNQLGELTAIDYSDGTVSVAYTNGVTDLNRQGQLRMVKDASGVWRMEYDYAGRLTALVRTNGTFNGITVSNRYNTVFGRDRVLAKGRSWSLDSTYGFDAYGRLSTVTRGGESASYQTNSDQVDIVGAASPLATMTVSGAATARRGEYFDCPLTVGSVSTPVAVVITNTATLGANTATMTGSMLVPPKTQLFTNDLDGNLTGDGLWAYTWDAENRLKSAETAASLTNWARCRLLMVYDHQGRRVTKTVQTNWNGSAYQSSITTKFVYDGWNLIAEINSSGLPVRSYVWGQDLSGTPDGAGGIGGLLMVKDHSDGSTHFPAYDGNGNVAALVRTDKTVTAHYEYGPFGELLRASKPFAKTNPFRFSTKYCDEETGLVYYGYRYYSPGLGRWLSRDPIGEEDGNSLYGFLDNNSINNVDATGQSKWNWRVAALMAILGLVSSGVDQGWNKASIDDELLEWTRKIASGEADLPKPQGRIRPKLPKAPRAIGATRQRVMSMVRRSSRHAHMGGGAGMIIGAVGLASDAQGSEAQAIVATFGDFGRDLANGDTPWADLDAATLAAQLQTATGDYFATMGVLDVLLTAEEMAR